MPLSVSASGHEISPPCPASCRLRSQDLDGNTHEEQLEGLMATAMQHEMDHLEGILFIDHLSRLKRNMALKKLEKMRKAAGVTRAAEEIVKVAAGALSAVRAS